MERRLPISSQHHPRCEGFTLVEVIISIFVLGALTLIFAACVPVARKTARMNGNYSQAISLCQHKIDQLRAVGFGRLNYTELEDAQIIDPTPNGSPYSFVAVDEVATYLPSPTATVSIGIVPGRSNEILVNARVTWHNTTYESKTSTASLSAIIANVE